MLQFFRNFFKTKIGLAIALAFLALIGFAFASMDVSSTGTFGGIAGGDNVAVVGDTRIGTADLRQATDETLRQARQQNPEATLETLLASGGLDEVLDNLINQFALIAWGEEHGLRAGRNLVNSEIQQIPGARGPTGEFSEDAYGVFLRQAGLTDASLRQQMRTTLFYRQSLYPAAFGAKIPDSIATTYARSFKERRSGAIATISADLFQPQGAPTEAQLNKFYADSKARFVRPERRTIRYATFGAEALGDSIEPTDQEIADYYKDNAARYAARETRSFTQLIVPTREGAAAIEARVANGASFDQAAGSAGLRTTALEAQDRSKIRAETSADVAAAYFSATEGSLTKPARSPLGWHIARVTNVESIPARSLAAARTEIVETLRAEKRQLGVVELATTIEDRLADGASLATLAEELKLDVQTLRPATASGRIYGANESVPPVIAPVLALAFQIEEGEPEISAMPDGQSFLVYEVSDITPSAAPQLAEIRNDVIAGWRQAEGNRGAEAAASRILKRVEGGQTLAAAVAAEKVAIRAPQSVNYSREELARMGNTRIPAPVVLLFSMAEGTAKKLRGTGDLGWYVVDLDSIALDKLQANDPLIAQAKAEISQSWSAEYAQQLVAAMRKEVGVERNETAIEAVRRQLLGQNN